MSAESKQVSDTLKPVLISGLTTQAYAALIAIPGFGYFFALPVLSSVSRFIIEKIVGWAVGETAVGLSLLWIMADLAYEVDSAESARVKLKDMLDNPKKYTEAQAKELEEHFDETSINLIQLSIRRL